MAALKKALKLKMPYCVSFVQIPCNAQVIEKIKFDLQIQARDFEQSMEMLSKRLVKRERAVLNNQKFRFNASQEARSKRR